MFSGIIEIRSASEGEKEDGVPDYPEITIPPGVLLWSHVFWSVTIQIIQDCAKRNLVSR